jgi:hypothetical protein
MQGERRQAVSKIREQIQRGEYVVDTVAVAEALLARLRALGAHWHTARGESPSGGAHRHTAAAKAPSGDAHGGAGSRRREAHSECSYPHSGAVAPANSTPGEPQATSPIHVSSTPALRAPA